ncbi:hypothetical protein Ciccas_008527 [Cichlidogyrus casuarinus]|uniref:dCMP deaminase n=1 Tax=Cichlidogyrus casuarinus TaxID=1844966 RepID=A0ABD2PZP2_9PLAT
MSIAFLSALRSKDPSTQVGACIVNDENKIVAVGYNVCHAELNAVLNSNTASLRGCTIYSTLFPCNECAKVIIQSGIKRVVFYKDDKKGTTSNDASKLMFERASINYAPYCSSGRLISFNL